MSDTDSEVIDNKERLGLTFHRTFSLMRSAVSQIIRAAEEVELKGGKKLDLQNIKELSSLGSIYMQAMPRYARGAGLLKSNNFLTDFGKYAIKFDPLLDQAGTQWLMHYHLSAPHGPGAPFWHEVTSKRFYPGSTFSAEDIFTDIGNFMLSISAKKEPPKPKGVRSTATIFLGTYIKIECLGKIHILKDLPNGRYRVLEPGQIPVWAFGYALLDYWSAYYPNRISVGLDTLQTSDFVKIFMIGKTELDSMLQALQEAHYVEVHRTSTPHQIYLLRPDGELLLGKLYGAD